MKKLAWGLTLLACATLAAYAGCKGDDEIEGPTGSCAPTDPSCPALAVASDCLALVDNSGQDVFAHRIAQLVIERPVALTNPLVYRLVSDATNINLPACHVRGDGTFALLAVFDRPRGMLRVGVATPEADPTRGFCFFYDAPSDVAPLDIPVDIGSDGTFRTGVITHITVPIFRDLTATSVVYLPLSQAALTNATLSTDQNCVGRYNAEGLDPRFDCVPDPAAGVHYFVNGGTLEGFITLEEADTVAVDELSQSLCVLLSGSPTQWGDGGDPIHCKRTAGQIDFQGDWCSQTDSEGGCADSMRLVAGFAASAAALRTDCPADPTGSGGGGMGGSAGGGGAGGAGGN